MPSVFHCPDCLLTFNTGLSGVGDFRQFTFCGSCGATHIVHFGLASRKMVIHRLRYDRDGPRFVSNDYLQQTDDGFVDLAFHSEVAPDASFVHGATPLIGNEFNSPDDWLSELVCMLCGCTDMRLNVDDRCACPSCNGANLGNVGGWM